MLDYRSLLSPRIDESPRLSFLLPLGCFRPPPDAAEQQTPTPAPSPPPGYPSYGSAVVAPPGDTTWLRIAKRTVSGVETFTAYASNHKQIWLRGGTGTHTLGTTAKIGLVSLGGVGFVANFDYLCVYTITP